jgi:CheY-like chemotaxis protein
MPRPSHFLLVEDNDDHADLLMMSLESNHAVNTIDRVVDGAEALDFLRRSGVYGDARRPDIILLDLNLPKLSGHQVLEQIKTDDDLCTIPVVVMTTSSSKSDREMAYKRHANSFMMKPVDFPKLQVMIRILNLYLSVWNQAPVVC